MTRKPAAIERHPGVHQPHVQGMPHQVIDQHRNPANAQRFVYKLHKLLWRQMVGEQCAAQHIERCAGEGKSESITGHRPAPIVQWMAKMRCGAIERSDLQAESTMKQALAGRLRHVSSAGGHLQQRQRRRADLTRYAPDHLLSRGDASEPAIDSSQIPERGRDLSGCSAVGIKQLGDDYALHKRHSSVVSNSLHHGDSLTIDDRRLTTVSRLPPAPLPATVCCKGRCSSHCAPAVRRECPVRRCGRRAGPRSGRHCVRWRRGGK